MKTRKRIVVTTESIKALKPCQDRLNNYLVHHKDFKGSLTQFLKLKRITNLDKIWVAIQVMPLPELEYFAIDCAFAAYSYAYAYDAAYTTAHAHADAAAHAAYTTAYIDADAAYIDERSRQVQALIYLCRGL